jgi:hypothetical protein
MGVLLLLIGQKTLEGGLAVGGEPDQDSGEAGE